MFILSFYSHLSPLISTHVLKLTPQTQFPVTRITSPPSFQLFGVVALASCSLSPWPWPGWPHGSLGSSPSRCVWVTLHKLWFAFPKLGIRVL